jgi:transposase
VLVDARGAPLAITISAANLHDSQAALTTLHALPLASPMQNPLRIYRIHHLCADKAYDAQSVRQGAEQMGYRTHIAHRTRTNQKDTAAHASVSDVPVRKYPARRWVVEPSHAWQNQFRALRVRWLKKEANWLGLIELAAGLILFRKAIYG